MKFKLHKESLTFIDFIKIVVVETIIISIIFLYSILEG
jgi:hypothetical protein